MCARGENDRQREREKEGTRVRGTGRRRCNERQRTGVEVADAIRRQCWRIAASSSGHNEPIRLYFYFRHAAYRAIPSRVEAATATLRTAHTHVRGPRIRRHACYTYIVYNEREIAAEHEERHGMAWPWHAVPRRATQDQAAPRHATPRPPLLRGPHCRPRVARGGR